MFKPSDYFNYWGAFTFDPSMYGSGPLLPAEDEYPGNLDSSARLNLFLSNGLRPYDFNKIRFNLGQMQTRVNRLVDQNFRDYSEIDKSFFKSPFDGTGIVTQDETTNQPVADMTNVTRNRIPRLDNGGFLPMPNSTAAQTGNGRLINPAGTEYISVEKDEGVITFTTGGTIRTWVSSAGWTNVDPGATQAPTLGFAIDFNPDKSIWVLFKDNEPKAYIDGNVITNNFVNVEPADNETASVVQAFVDLDSTKNVIQFSCQTENDSVVRGVGFIDATGTNDVTEVKLNTIEKDIEFLFKKSDELELAIVGDANKDGIRSALGLVQKEIAYIRKTVDKLNETDDKYSDRIILIESKADKANQRIDDRDESEELEESIDRVIAGPERKSRKINQTRLLIRNYRN